MIDISDDGFTSLLDEDKNETRDDIKLPAGDLGIQLITFTAYTCLLN